MDKESAIEPLRTQEAEALLEDRGAVAFQSSGRGAGWQSHSAPFRSVHEELRFCVGPPFMFSGNSHHRERVFRSRRFAFLAVWVVWM